MIRSVILTLSLSLLFLLSCSAGNPSPEIVEQTIREALEKKVPPEIVDTKLIGLPTKAVKIEKLGILKVEKEGWTRHKEEKVHVWRVDFYAEGTSQSIVSTSTNFYKFEGETKLYIYKDKQTQTWRTIKLDI